MRTDIPATKMLPIRNKKIAIILCGVSALLAALTLLFMWDRKPADISEIDLKLITKDPLPSKANKALSQARVIRPDEEDAVSEKVAQSLIRQLKAWGPQGQELAESLYECSAIHASNMEGNKSSCFDKYSGEAKDGCLRKRGYGRKSVGQVLAADRFDLNGDGIADYIVFDRYYCQQLSANQSSVYFVLLSRGNDEYRLSYADWASSALEVVEHPSNGSKVLIERAGRLYRTYSRVKHLINDKYVDRICVVEDEHGHRRCEAK